MPTIVLMHTRLCLSLLHHLSLLLFLQTENILLLGKYHFWVCLVQQSNVSLILFAMNFMSCSFEVRQRFRHIKSLSPSPQILNTFTNILTCLQQVDSIQTKKYINISDSSLQTGYRPRIYKYAVSQRTSHLSHLSNAMTLTT